MPLNLDLGISAQALQVRARRAELLANNIANADTPGFKAQDIDFREVLAQSNNPEFGANQLAQTHSGHLDLPEFAGAGVLAGAGAQYRIPAQPALDGNTVEAQMERAEFAENQLRYQASVKFLDDRVQAYKRAFRGQ